MKPVVTIDLSEYNELKGFDPYTEDGMKREREIAERIFSLFMEKLFTPGVRISSNMTLDQFLAL